MSTSHLAQFLLAMALLANGLPAAVAAADAPAVSAANSTQKAPTPIPSYSAPVIDLTGTLTEPQVTDLLRYSADLKKKTGAELAVLMVPTLGGQSVEQYAERVNDKWRLGHFWKKDGILLLIAKDDRKMRISVGSDLNDTLDGEPSVRILRNRLAPSFGEGKFYEGIAGALTAISVMVEMKTDAEVRAKRSESDDLPSNADLQAASDEFSTKVLAPYAGVLTQHVPGTIHWDFERKSCKKLFDHSLRCEVSYTTKTGRRDNYMLLMRTSSGWHSCEDPKNPSPGPKIVSTCS